MFDIGFPELVVISIVALLVIGPEKLPETIRTISLWIGRIQRSFSNIRREIETEIGADDIRAQLHNEAILKDLEATKNTLQDVSRDIKDAVEEVKSDVKGTMTEPVTETVTEPVTEPVTETVTETTKAVEKTKSDDKS